MRGNIECITSKRTKKRGPQTVKDLKDESPPDNSLIPSDNPPNKLPKSDYNTSPSYSSPPDVNTPPITPSYSANSSPGSQMDFYTNDLNNTPPLIDITFIENMLNDPSLDNILLNSFNDPLLDNVHYSSISSPSNDSNPTVINNNSNNSVILSSLTRVNTREQVWFAG